MSKALKDAGVLLAIILASALVYWDSLKLRAGTYDPLGSGTMPRIVAGLIIILSLVALAQGFFGSRPAPQPLLFEDEEEFERRPWLAVTIFFYLVGCIVLLALRVPFGISSALFLFVSCLSIKKFDPRSILPAAACSLGVGFGLTYMFGTLFGVDLP